MAEIAASNGKAPAPLRQALVRWGSAAVLVTAIGFIVDRLAGLHPQELYAQRSWPLLGAMAAASVLFAAADVLFARGWAMLADPAKIMSPAQAQGIYGRGVLTKYLPGSIFQYISRQVGGQRAGLPSAALVKASIDEAVIHIAASLSVAALLLIAGERPLLAGAAAIALMAALHLVGTPRLRVLAVQMLAFAGFGLAAAITAATLFPISSDWFSFGGIFLLAWLAGFLIPVAPGGLGVREAALLAMAGALVPVPEALAAVLALRVSSIIGDLAYGSVAVWHSR